MRRALRRPLAVVVAVVSALALATLTGVGSASAVNYSLPSLWQSYQGDFAMGTFGAWGSQQALYEYRSNSLPNELKLDSQIGTSNTNSLSRQAYVAAVTQINADPTLDDTAKAAAVEKANENIVLQPTLGANQAEGILQAIEAYNAANNLPEDQKKIVRAHVLAWHGGQQPNWFFSNGFVYNAASPDWASPDTMLKRLDNYIHLMMDKYAKYSDIIVSWDVVNEAVDDFSGQIRNGDDAQVSQWGRIFRRPDLDGDPDARLYAESAWVRQAFSSARTWSDEAGAHWKLYYNDFQDSDKLYEPKMSQTIKMLKPIHDAGNIDGYGMQGRLAWAYPSIAQLKTQIDAGLTVANEISITESDIRSDFEPNPDYDPTQPTRRVTEAGAADPAHQWPTYGSCSWTLRAQANGNTFDVCNSPVRRIPAWGTGANDALANSPDIMRKQADFAADWMDLLLSYPGKIVIDDWDGTSDSNTFNRTDGAQLWSGQPGNAEKYSFFAVIGAPAREKLRDAIAQADAIDRQAFTAESWQRVADARAAAAALVDVRIYTIDGVTAVKDATSALTGAIDKLERSFTHVGADPAVSGPAKVGGTLTVHPGDWQPQPVTLSYQWYRSGAAIDGATDSTYTLVDADEGQRVSVAVTGSKPGYAPVTEKSRETDVVVRPAPGPIVDTVTSALSANGSNVATATVTAGAGDLLVAYVASDSPAAGGQTSTVSGGGLTWTLAGRADRASGAAEVWTARAGTALDQEKITARGTLKKWDESITVIGYQNAGGVGAVVTASSDRGAPRATLTTTAPDSWVFASGDDWLSPVHRTLGADQTLVNESFTKLGDTYWVQSAATPSAAAGTAVTINDKAPTQDPYNLVLVEILATEPAPPAAARPTISSVSVAPGDTLSGTVTLSAAVVPGDDNASSRLSYTYLELNRDGTWLADNTTAPGSTNNGASPTLVLDTATYPNGTYNLKIDAVAVGGATTEQTISFTIKNGPTLSFAAPGADASVSGTIPVSVQLGGADLQAYNLRIDSTGLQYLYQPEPATQTFELSTTTLTNGVHTLLATATDSAGNATTITEKITVNNPPVVRFLAPSGGLTLGGIIPISVALSGQGLQTYSLQLDGNGLQYQSQPRSGLVTFRLDSTAWTGGPHTLVATVTDDAGNTTTITEKITISN